MNSNKNLVIEQQMLTSSDATFVPQLNIAFAIDQNYLKPCGVCIFSILKNNPNINFDFHIFTNYFNSFGFDELLRKFGNFRIHIYKINTSYFDGLQTTGHFTTAIYYRLSIASILKNKIEKYLYLDADILCFSKLDELLDVSLDAHILAAVEDEYVRKDYISELGLPPNSKYFNSGVLYINTQKWLDFDLLEKFKNKINLRSYKYPDQDVLNVLLKNDILFLNEKFNYFSEKDITPVFKHFVSTPKPWSICVSENLDYLNYYYESPWKDQPLDAPRNSKESKKYAIKLFKSGDFLQSLKWFLMYLRGKI